MTIVVGYLPTPEGLAALDAAIAEATSRGRKLVVVNTGESGDYSTSHFASAQEIDTLDTQLEELGLAHEVRQPTSGRSVADELLSVAEELDAELVVIGVRRRSPLGKLILGSTAQEVLLSAACPVLAVKPPRRDP